jgi:hypothetical protein
MVIFPSAVGIVAASPCARDQKVTELLLLNGHLWPLAHEEFRVAARAARLAL